MASSDEVEGDPPVVERPTASATVDSAEGRKTVRDDGPPPGVAPSQGPIAGVADDRDLTERILDSARKE